MVARETSTSEEKYNEEVHVGSRADKHDRYCKRLTNQEAFEMLERSKFKLKKRVFMGRKKHLTAEGVLGGQTRQT